MERACHRCGQTIDDNLAFCSSCGAPQIKVSRAPELPVPEAGSATPDLPHPAPVVAYDPSSLVSGIEWRHFLQVALPLSVLTGVVTVILPPLGFFVILPACTILSISRYQHRRARSLRGGQGARMGAMTATLSFGFFLATFSVLWGTYRSLIVGKIQEAAAQTPDLQARQMMQWLATPEGLPVFLIMFLGMILVVFLLVGLASGALAARLGRNRPRV
jgi:uncharacterized membrane protein